MLEPISDSQVEQVELFEDRAAVTRRVTLPAGSSRLLLSGVSPVLVERSLGFSGAVEVLTSRVERELVHTEEADTALARQLQQRIDELKAELSTKGGEQRRAAEAAQRAAAIVETAHQWNARALHQGNSTEQDSPSALGSPPGDTTGRDWVTAVRELEEQCVSANMDAQAQEAEVQRLSEELEYQKTQLALARQGRSRWRATLHAEVYASAPTELRLRYTVPCALWRPLHRAWLDGDRVRWSSGAMCWNASGEDWEEVRLLCSTERPGDPAAPPVLTDDLLHVQQRAERVEVEAREEQVQVAREGGTRAVEQALGVDDGGETRVYLAPNTVQLSSNGQPVMVELEHWESEAHSKWIAHPELDAVVVLRTRLLNHGARPLLAGPVEQFRNGAAIGVGMISLVPPGEPFALGWGESEAVLVSRRQDTERDTQALTGKQRVNVQLSTRVVNLSDQPQNVLLRERIPVSELKEIKVGSFKASPRLSVEPDADGLCAWELALKPHSEQTLSVQYRIEADSKVRLPI